jgi:hypothetical protein
VFEAGSEAQFGKQFIRHRTVSESEKGDAAMKDIFDELEEIQLKKIRRIETLAKAVVTKLNDHRSQDLKVLKQALHKSISELRAILGEAKLVLKAAKIAQSRHIR